MEYATEIHSTIQTANALVKGLFAKLSPIYKDEFGPDQDVTVPLFTALHATSESILVLLTNRAIFDADVLLRTVMEGTAKYCYLMIGETQKRHEKYLEYKISLTEIDKLIDHNKAIETIATLVKYSDNSTKPFELSILPDSEVTRLKQHYPAKTRNEIKGRWSYQSLLNSIASDRSEYKAQLGLLSTYSLTSHFGHFDWNGVSVRQSQIANSYEVDCTILDIGHAIRIVSNLTTFYIFRVTEYMRGNNYKSLGIAQLSLEAIEFADELAHRGNEIIEHYETVPHFV